MVFPLCARRQEAHPLCSSPAVSLGGAALGYVFLLRNGNYVHYYLAATLASQNNQKGEVGHSGMAHS
jgi:hypothetical protein